MTAQYPNRKCTCGYTRFRERRVATSSNVQRWMLLSSSGGGGFGATPFGTYFGTGPSGSWGLFNATYRAARLETLCESCSRIRSTRQLGGITAIGSYVSNGLLCVVAADVQRPATCYSLRFSGSQEFERELGLASGLPAAVVAPYPPVTIDTPPPGAELADTLLCAVIPEVSISGDYTVYLVDRCSGYTIPLVTIYLESEPMMLLPTDADLNGAPRIWMFGGAASNPIGQPASGSRLSIPFDRCTGVLEYDARFGSLPSAQGFSHVGAGVAGDYQLVEGGVLRVETAAGLDSYWEQTLVLGSAATCLYTYAVLRDDNTPIAGGAAGDGLQIDARYSLGLTFPYAGARLAYADATISAVRLDGVSDTQPFGTLLAPGWLEVAGSDDNALAIETAWGDGIGVRSAGTYYGTFGSAAAVDMILRFGDVNASAGLIGYIRNVVASANGRFIRAQWGTYTQVSDPVVRFYFVSDANASVAKTARFRLRYGSGTASPYAALTSSQEVTINFTVANTVFEQAFALTGLTANAPFWLSLERVWDSGDDGLDATVHLLYGTVRTQ